MNKSKGFAAIILVVGVLVVVALAAGYLYFSKTGDDYPGKDYVDRYTSSSTVEISDSDDPTVIHQEFNETDLSLDEFEKDLNSLDADLQEI